MQEEPHKGNKKGSLETTQKVTTHSKGSLNKDF